MGLALEKLTGVNNLQNMDPTTHQVDACSWKLTGETNSNSTTPHMEACSWKVTGESNLESTLWLTGKFMKFTQLDTTSQKLIGGDHDPNHMHELMLSEVDWGAHDSSLLHFLVNIDYDAMSKEFFIQGLWGELQHRTPSIPLIGLLIDSYRTNWR